MSEIKLHLSKNADVKEAVLTDGTVQYDVNMEIEAVTVPAWKLKEISERIADLERHNELLRAALEASVENTDKILNYLVTRNLPAAMEVSNLIKTVELQAAIDGGALEVE